MLGTFKNIVIFFFCFTFFKVAAQDYNFWNYTVQNGLVGSQVNTVFQDELGFLWIGTESGVSKYDGTTFYNFDKFDNLSSNSITHITQDKQGVLWFGHRDGSVTSYLNNEFNPVLFEGDSVCDFSLNFKGDLLVTTPQNIYSLKNNEKPKTLLYNIDVADKFIKSHNLNDSIFIVVSHNKIQLFKVNEGELILNQNKEYPVKISHFATDNKCYFISSLQGEMFMLDKDLNVKDKLHLNTKINYVECADNRLFLSYEEGVIILTKNEKIEQLKKLKTNGVEINKTYLDKENILWMPTAQKGLMALPKSHFLRYGYPNDLGNLLSYTDIPSLTLFFEKGIIKPGLNQSNFSVSNRFTEKINTALLTQNNEVWYGTNKGLFLRFSGSTIEYEFKEFKGKKINALTSFNEDVLIATDEDLFIYKPSTNKVTSFTSQYNLNAFGVKRFNILNDVIYGIGKGNIIKISQQEVSFLFKDNNVKELDFTSLNSYKENLLIGTQGKGILEYYPNKSYINLTEKLNLPYRYVISIQQMNDSVLWFTTKLGIVKINNKKGEYNLYGQRYLGDLNFIPQTPIRKDENCFFISDKGLILMESHLFDDNKINDIKITSLQVSGVDKEITTNTILNYGNYPVKINYELVSLNDKTYFQYKLDGFSNYWSDATAQKNVTYLNLTPGKYTFRVRTVNPKNNEFGVEQTLNFEINIPFWKTTKFWIFTALGLACLFLTIYFFRILSLRAQKRKLQKQVEQKTFELSLQKKQLEQFSYSLSHDLKNPVNNIKGLVEILEENKSDEVISMLSQSTEVLENKILEALNSIKRTQANVKEVKEVLFNGVFNKVKKSLMMLIKENNAELSIDFSVPNIQYEETLIESIMYNLISNAIKYKHPDRTPQINIYTEQINDLVRLSVTDNGLGFDVEKEKENLFSIFKRVHTQGEGTGIGLYMIKQMVEINGGSIDVESEIGEGTTFHVYLKPLKVK